VLSAHRVANWRGDIRGSIWSGMLTRRFGALLDGLQAIGQPDKELHKQTARRKLEINDARGQLFDLEMERLRLMLTNPLNRRLAETV